MTVRVIKLGGSLLDLPDLAKRTRRWLALQTPHANRMVVGGGALADAIRAADRTHALGEEASHELCLHAMGLTAALARQIFELSRVHTGADQIEPRDPAETTSTAFEILDVRNLLAEPSPAGLPELPHTWQVTSDSIAAHVARRLGAVELVLLKSAIAPDGSTAQQLADLGFVDGFFPTAIGGLCARIVNLRDPNFAECRLEPAEILQR